MRILHVFRSPVGGLFRHVRDLVRGQALLGHEVGLICDSSTGGKAAEEQLAALAPHCRLGIARQAISTLPGLGDLAGRKIVMGLAREWRVDVIHGHGAKGGAYARLAATALGLPGVYTPHGGSLHYDWLKPPGALFLAAERALRRKGTGLLFVCEFERRLYDSKIGLAGTPSRVVYNGLWPEDFAPRQLAPNAAELFFIGEMRALKGVDVLLEAIAQIPENTRPRLNLIGEGRDMAEFKSHAARLSLEGRVQFLGRKDFRSAASTGRLLVMPSRNESFPYVVLEAVAAGVPIIASRVGGIPEALPASQLVPPGESGVLAAALATALAQPARLEETACRLRSEAQGHYSAENMARDITSFYSTLN